MRKCCTFPETVRSPAITFFPLHAPHFTVNSSIALLPASLFNSAKNNTNENSNRSTARERERKGKNPTCLKICQLFLLTFISRNCFCFADFLFDGFVFASFHLPFPLDFPRCFIGLLAVSTFTFFLDLNYNCLGRSQSCNLFNHMNYNQGALTRSISMSRYFKSFFYSKKLLSNSRKPQNNSLLR